VTGLLAGCTRTREAKVARLDLPIAERTQLVRYGGNYVARWTPTNRKDLKTIPGSMVAANKGDTLGFTRTEDGRLFAVHGEQRFPLQTPPGNARYVVWYNEAVVQTQFGKEVQEAGEGAGEVLKVVGTGALFVGLLWLAAENDDDHCDDEDDFNLMDLFTKDDD
jgi:hypothetical protein